MRGNPAAAGGGDPLAVRGRPGDLSFLTRAGYREEARASRAGALLVGREETDLPQDLLICPEPAWALGELIRRFHPAAAPPAGIHATAVVAATAEVDPTAQPRPARGDR